MQKVIPILLVFLISCTNTKKQSGSDWKYLFNGKDLTGWLQLGGDALFEVKDGAIIGTSVMNTPNSFLCTEEAYGDFILELEFKVDPTLNSGIQIRSLSLPDYRDGRVHGYQVEIDPSERAWSAGIFDESRRGWLYPLNTPENEEARKAFKQNEWNKVRVEAIGHQMKTWLNDVPAANLFDEQTAEGFIALQVHSIRQPEEAGTQVAWRNIRIITENLSKFSMETSAPERSYLLNQLTEQEKLQGWKLLFDGHTFAGWRGINNEEFPSNNWEIKDGILTVNPAAWADKRKRTEHIMTIEQYADFELTLEVKITEVANSGIKYFFLPDIGGPEYQILDDQRHPDAKMGRSEGIRIFASLYDLMKPEGTRPNQIGQWNTVKIVSKDNHIEHWLNGFKVLEYNRESEEFRKLVAESKFADITAYAKNRKGHIHLQDHKDEVSFRSIKIREL